jgi:glycosyltransferase involved in cell wall biosynthesis
VKVVYDYQIFNTQKYGGVSRYVYEVATRIARYPDIETKILAGTYINKYLTSISSDLVVGWHRPYVPKTTKILGLVNYIFTKIWLKRYEPDIIHETYYSMESIATKNCKKVITVHDMIHEKFNHLMPQAEKRFIETKHAAIKRADKIICVSQNTKRDLQEILEIDSDKISVIHSGYTFLSSSKDANFFPSTNTPYILYVGERNAYKNFKRLLEAYAKSSKLRKDFNLVCFGSQPFSSCEIQQINSLEIDERNIIQVSGNDRVLANLYEKASAFVYPSLYEGFGLPLLEAMSCGCPVVCSNTSSIPEIVGDAAEFFNPYEIESIANALEKVLYSSEITQKLIMIGKERVKKFSWDTSAERHRLVYQSLL